VPETSLVVQTREGAGKGAARKLRASGLIPAVLYGSGRETVSISLDPRQLERILRTSGSGLNTLLEVTVEGRTDRSGGVALVKELQRDPVRGSLLHADLYEVDLAKTVEVEVPVHLVGKPKGVELGGILDALLREVTLECLPRSIPDSLSIDISGLEIGDVVHVRDIPLPGDVTLLTDGGLAVAHVVAPTVEAEPGAAEAAEAAAAAPGEAPGEAPAEGGGGED
jgi:large subunit ribosomal protein L25